jgi:hypothetical protein
MISWPLAFALTLVAEVPILWAVLRPRPWYLAIRTSALANLASYVAGMAVYLAWG